MSGRVPPTSDSPRVLVFPPVLFLAALGLGLLAHWVHPVRLIDSPTLARGAGLLLLLLSTLLARSAEREMKRAGTNVRPDRPSLAIVTEGPFRYSRNPLYLAGLGLYLAVALLANTLWPFALLPVMLLILDWGIVRREERYLEAKFGGPYRAYRARVRRWI